MLIFNTENRNTEYNYQTYTIRRSTRKTEITKGTKNNNEKEREKHTPHTQTRAEQINK